VVHRDDGGGVDTTRPVGGRAERGIARADDAAQPSEAPRLSALVAAVLPRIDRLQQRHRVLGVPYAVFKRFGEHDGGRLAAVVSYYSFFSVFPLLLVFVTVLGLVLQDNEELREELVDGALGQIPVIGSELASAGSLPGSGFVLALGIVTALWAGLGAVAAVQQGLDVIADVPVHQRSNFFVKKAREVSFLILFAIGLAVSTLAGNLATVFDVGPFAGALGLVTTAVVDALLLLVMFTILPSRRRAVRELLPGVLVGAVLLVILQQLGSFVVRRYIAGAGDTYGTFAIVIALLSWFFLVSRVVLMSAQANQVLADGLTPRRLWAGNPPTDADRRATLLDVHRIQRDAALGYAVSVDGDVATNEDPVPDREPAG
jgi:membrane protein